MVDQEGGIRFDLSQFPRLRPYHKHSDLNHELSRVDAFLLLSSFQLEHVYPAEHSVESAL